MKQQQDLDFKKFLTGNELLPTDPSLGYIAIYGENSLAAKGTHSYLTTFFC